MKQTTKYHPLCNLFIFGKNPLCVWNALSMKIPYILFFILFFIFGFFHIQRPTFSAFLHHHARSFDNSIRFPSIHS